MIELTFIATDVVEVLLNEEKLFDKYYINGELCVEGASIDTYDNLIRMLNFIFGTDVEMIQLASEGGIRIFDLTSYKQAVIAESELGNKYEEWISVSQRENTMDEYGQLACVVGYIEKNIDKKHLILIAGERKTSELNTVEA